MKINLDKRDRYLINSLRVLAVIVPFISLTSKLSALSSGYVIDHNRLSEIAISLIGINLLIGFGIYVFCCLYENIAEIKNTLIKTNAENKSDE